MIENLHEYNYEKIKKISLQKICAYSRLSDNLLDSKTSPKSYLSILKTFLKRYLVFHLCCTIANLSWTLRKRPNVSTTSLQSSVLLLITTVSFPQLSFRHCDILKIISRNKAQGHNKYLIVKNLWLIYLQTTRNIFSLCLENGKFPSEWKKSKCGPCL